MEYNDTTLDSPNSFCRACLKEVPQQHMYYINTLDLKLRQWLQDSTLQHPQAEDLYPKYVCAVCCEKLDSFLQFHQMCERSRQMYKEIVERIPNTTVNKTITARTFETNEMNNDVQQQDDPDEKNANCDWLEFDFVAAPVTSGSSLTSLRGQEQESCGGDEVTATTSRASLSQRDNVNNSKGVYEEISTPHNAQPGQHICEECGQVFEKVILLKQHQYSHRPDQEHPYFCNECNKIFKNRRTLTEHQMRHAGIKNFECPYCGIRKTTKYELQAHINYHTKERQWLCPNCPMIFNSTRNLRTHDQVVHQGLRRYICQYCEKAFGKPDALKQHIMTHTGEKPHECLECSKRFAQLVSLKTHMMKTTISAYSTKTAKQKGSNLSLDLENSDHQEETNHITTNDGKPNKSQEIKEILTNKSKDLQQHDIKSKTFRQKLKATKKSPAKETISISNTKPNQNKHICEECGKICASLVRLKQHQYSHRPPEEHPYHCNECNKTFRTYQSLNDHHMRHAGIKNYECAYCGMKKTTKSELRTHVNYHTKERQWLCPHCPMIFNSTSNLRRHDQVVHKGIRRYSCRYCDEAFGKQETLKHHEMTHTGEKPHKCLECGKRFIQSVSLKTHMKIHNKK